LVCAPKAEECEKYAEAVRNHASELHKQPNILTSSKRWR